MKLYIYPEAVSTSKLFLRNSAKFSTSVFIYLYLYFQEKTLCSADKHRHFPSNLEEQLTDNLLRHLQLHDGQIEPVSISGDTP